MDKWSSVVRLGAPCLFTLLLLLVVLLVSKHTPQPSVPWLIVTPACVGPTVTLPGPYDGTGRPSGLLRATSQRARGQVL